MRALVDDAAVEEHGETSAQALIDAGVRAHRAGALDEAKKCYLEVLQRTPTCADAWHLVGILVQQMGDAEGSIKFIARAIELSPQQAMYYSNLGTALHEIKRMEEAIAFYRHALHLDPNFADAAYNLGNTCAWLERDEEAAAAYLQALDAEPGSIRARLGLGQLFFGVQMDAEADEQYRLAVEADPGSADAQFLLGRSLLNAGDADAALRHYRLFKEALCAKPSLPNPGEELLPLQSIATFCETNARAYRELIGERTFQVPAPLFDNPVADVSVQTGVLAPAYVAHVGAAEVFGWQDTVIAQTPRTVLYDMPTRLGSRALECEHGIAKYVTANHAILDGAKESNVRIPRGVMLAGRGWDSYAHWIIDFLPKFLLLEQCPEYADWPLLVDSGLYPQQIESLRQVVGLRREFRPLAAHTRYKVDDLVIASDLSGMRMQSYRARALPDGNGAVVAPEALAFLRQRMLGDGALRHATSDGRRLYVSRRRQTTFRRLINECVIEQLFVEHGFEVIYPETMPFADQVRAFNDASLVAGAAGSNMIGTIFCGAGTRILMLAMWHPRLNYHFFSNIAHLLGHHLLHVLGRIVTRHDYYYQSDFMVEPDDVRHALRSLDAC